MDSVGTDKVALRGLDVNSLLRLYDRAAVPAGAETLIERGCRERLLGRVTAELQRRGVRA